MQTKLALLIIISLLISACETGNALLAFAGMGVVGATEARPDRAISYDLQIETTDGFKVNFSDETFCPHSVSGATYKGHYGTDKRFTYSQDKKWMLSGINCNDVISEKNDTEYQLYQIIDDYHARQYFVRGDGNARVINSQFEKSYAPFIEKNNQINEKYGLGPYIVTITKLINQPEILLKLKVPTVIYPGKNLCGRSNENVNPISLEKSAQVFKYKNTKSSKNNILTYNSSGHYWEIGNLVFGMAPDVATRKIRNNTDDSRKWDPEPGCVHINYLGNIYVLSEHDQYSQLYDPAENILISVERVWDRDYSKYFLNNESN